MESRSYDLNNLSHEEAEYLQNMVSKYDTCYDLSEEEITDILRALDKFYMGLSLSIKDTLHEAYFVYHIHYPLSLSVYYNGYRLFIDHEYSESINARRCISLVNPVGVRIAEYIEYHQWNEKEYSSTFDTNDPIQSYFINFFSSRYDEFTIKRLDGTFNENIKIDNKTFNINNLVLEDIEYIKDYIKDHLN